MRRLTLLVLCAAAVACGKPQPRDPAADTVAPLPAGTPSLVVGNRYETQAGAIVCPTPDAMRRMITIAQGGDAAAFEKALTDAHCSPVMPGAVIVVAEQQREMARVQRSNDASTYWMLAEKLTPRGR